MFRKNLLSGGSALLLTACALAGPAAAGTVQLSTSATAKETYNSNVLSRGSDVKSDWVTTLVPEARLTKEGRRGALNVRMSFPVLLYKEYDELNGVNRLGRYDANYALTKRTQLFSAGRYSFTANTDAVTEQGPDGTDTILNGGRADLTSTSFEGGMRYAFAPTLFTTASYRRTSFDYDQGDLRSARDSDTTTDTGSFSLTHQYGLYDSLGLTASYSSSDFTNEFRPDSSSDMGSVTANWIRTWNDSWFSSISLGVRRVKSDFTGSTIEPVDPGALGNTSVDDTSFTGTGQINVVRRGPRSRLSFVASQQTTPSSGFGTDLDVETLSGTFMYRLTKRLSVTASTTWSRQQSVGDTVIFSLPIGFDFGANQFLCRDGSVLVVVSGQLICGGLTDAGVDTRLFVGSLEANWRLSKRLSTFLSYQYRDQTSDGDLFQSDFDRHLLSFGVRYNYEMDVY